MLKSIPNLIVNFLVYFLDLYKMALRSVEYLTCLNKFANAVKNQFEKFKYL